MANPALTAGLHTANINGTDLRYEVAGQGPVLVVQAPGWGIGASPYTGSFAPLESDFTVVYVHPRGSRGALPEPVSKLTVGQFVEDLEGLRRSLGLETIALAGHSHGGLIAMHYALRYPARVRSLVLLAPQLVGVPSHPDERDDAPDPSDPGIRSAYAYLESVGGFHRMSTMRSDAEATAFLHGIAPLYFKDTRHAAMLRAVLDAAPLPVRTLQAVSGTDGAFALEAGDVDACRVPTLALSGRYDLFCPPSTARQLVGMIGHGTQVIFEESGHFPWVEEPGLFFPTVKGFLIGHTVIPAR